MTDALLIGVALLLLASPNLLLMLSYLPAFSKIRPYTERGELSVSAPCFGWQTNAQNVYATVTLNLTNVGPFDLQCRLEWFDWRTTDDFSAPVPYGIAFRNPLYLRKGASYRMTLVAANISEAFPTQLGCYEFCWEEAPSLPRRWRQAIRAAAGRGPEWMPESGYTFGSNLAVDEYFSLVHGLDRTRYGLEEQRERELPTNGSSKLELALRLSDETARKAALEEARKETEIENKLGAIRWYQSAARRNVRKVYGDWLHAQSLNKIIVRHSAELGAAPNGGPAAAVGSSGADGGRHR